MLLFALVSKRRAIVQITDLRIQLNLIDGDGGGTCITRQQNDEIIVGTNIAPYDSIITKFKVQ